MTVKYSLNELIVVLKKKKPVLGIVTSIERDVVKFLSEDGKEWEYPPEKIDFKSSIILSDKSNSSEKKLELREYRRELNESSRDLDLESLWESVVGSVKNISFDDLKEIYYGDKTIENLDVLRMFWAVNRDDVYFRGENGLYAPVPESEVKTKLAELEKERRKIEETDTAVNWFLNFRKGNDGEAADFEKQYFVELIESYVLNEGSKDRLREAKGFLNKVGLNTPEDASQLLIDLGVWEKNSDPELKKLESFESFSKKALEEAEEIKSKDFVIEDYTDLRSKNIFTIDDEDTEDIDDAISIEIEGDYIEVGVHISNVAYYIQKDSRLDIEACKKGDTVYIPDKRIDILPKDLIKDVFSLYAGKPRLALSLLVRFDKKTYEVKEYEFIKSVISVTRNYSYKEAEEELLREKAGKELVNISMALRRKRVLRGAFILQLPELKFDIDENEKIEIYKNYMNSIPHMIIAELMILMNNIAGKVIRENEIPSVYRVQNEEISQDAREMDINDPLYNVKVVKHLRPSLISTNPDRHRSLGLDCYVQITSPIRRYTDLVVQRQIISIIEGDKWLYDGKELFEIIGNVADGFGERRLLQKNRKKYWLFRYLKDHVNEKIKGIVSAINERNILVYIPEFLIELPIKNFKGIDLKEYQEVDLEIESIDPLRKKINLLIA